MGELLCKNESYFDPAYKLLIRDIKIGVVDLDGKKTEAIHILLKAPKESKVGKSIIVDVYQTGGPTCPVKAYKKWFKMASAREPEHRK